MTATHRALAANQALPRTGARPPPDSDFFESVRPAAVVPATPPAPLAVLLVESHPDCAESLALLLGLYGYSVTVAASGEAALRSATAFPPDVVIVEPRLHGCDGCDLIRRLRSLGMSPPFVIAVTTGGRTEDRRRAAAAGVDLHFVKPADPRELEAALGRYAAGRAAA